MGMSACVAVPREGKWICGCTHGTIRSQNTFIWSARGGGGSGSGGGGGVFRTRLCVRMVEKALKLSSRRDGC